MKKITLILILLLAFGFSYGQSIFTNPITDSDPEDDNPYTNNQVVDANITVSGIGRGSNIAPNNGTNRYNARGWNSSSINLNDYFEFILTPNSGYEIDFVSFVYTSQRSGSGPTNFAFRTSIDGFTSNIGAPTAGGLTTIDLTAATYQSITEAITFRIYGWGASSGLGTFSVNSFTFNGLVTSLGTCTSVSTWDGAAWDVAPTSTAVAVIDGNFTAVLANSFSACTLIVNSGSTLTVDNTGFVEIENDVIVDGDLIVQTEGNFVQRGNTGTFTNNGVSRVNKQTAAKSDWYYYTYWSSPVVGETIGSVFPDVDGDRRFKFNAANFLDADGDDFDDNDDAWEAALAGETMSPGVGYAATESRFFVGGVGTASFEGPFNTGDVSVGISNVPGNAIASWNFIGNPYPSAIDFDAFHAANNTVVDGAAYFWSQATDHAESNPGNQQSNFSKNDYATYTVGSGGAAGGSPVIPSQYIPSGQGFFIASLAPGGTATFTNAMRMADGTSNSQFFRNSGSKKNSGNSKNRLWVNLTTENGVFSQILMAYVDGATDGYDGLSYDAPKIVSQDFPAILYSFMESDNNKYVIQGKSPNSINENELVSLGFSSNIDTSTEYTLSIAQLEGAFLSDNPTFVKDNFTNTLHNLSDSDYSFTSVAGEFNNRFEIVFNANALSIDDISVASENLKIIELEDDNVQFTTKNHPIETVKVFDLLGRELYNFKGNSNDETYKLSNLSSTVYIVKVELSNGIILTKKTLKK